MYCFYITINCLYKQIDDVAMGSPLGPTLANFFLVHIKTELLDCCICRPKLYTRFVGNCFAIFNNDSSSLDYFQFAQF